MQPPPPPRAPGLGRSDLTGMGPYGTYIQAGHGLPISDKIVEKYMPALTERGQKVSGGPSTQPHLVLSPTSHVAIDLVVGQPSEAARLLGGGLWRSHPLTPLQYVTAE